MSKSGKPADAPFLSRWSQRKIDAGKAVKTGDSLGVAVEPDAGNAPSTMTPRHLIDDPRAEDGSRLTPSGGAAVGASAPGMTHSETASSGDAHERPELPAIDSLTHEADFSPFMAKDVDPGLRNQAMKKLFTDPHYQFGQMDKLDIYIDDYSQPDPIPPEMLRQMYQAKSLFLFEDEEKDSPPRPISFEENAAAPAAIAPEPAPGNDQGPADAAANVPEEIVGLTPNPVPVKPA